MKNAEKTFDYKLIRDELSEVLNFVENKIEREWVEKYKYLDSGKETLLPYLRIAKNTFKTILFICSDIKDNSTREEYFALAVSPLTRTLLEILFSVVYLLENFPEKIKLFDKSYYKEQKGATDWFRQKYSGIKKWDKYLSEKNSKLNMYEEMLLENNLLTENEKNNLDQIRYFPRVSKIISRLEDENSDAVTFLKYLDDLHYRALSGQSHLEPSGIVEFYPFFLNLQFNKNIADEIAFYKSKQVYLATSFILSLISEIVIDFNYELKSKLAYIWVLLSSGSELSEEIYQMRYQKLLAEQ